MSDPTAGNDPIRAQMEGTLRQLTVADGARFFEALAGMNRDNDGRELAALILKFDSSPATHAALAKAAKRAGNDGLAEFVGH